MDKTYSEKVIERATLNKKLTIAPFAQSFRWCNNDCSFCYLKTTMFNKPLPIDKFKMIGNNVINWLEEYTPIIPKDIKILFLMIGGELFCLSDEYYEAMEDLIYKATMVLKKYGRQIDNLAVCSNLILSEDRLNRLHKFYLYCNDMNIKIDINTSYDIEGRFRSEDVVKIWYNNLLEVVNNWDCKYRPEVEMVLSKPSIMEYVDDKDTWQVKYFKKIFDLGYKVDFCTKEYIPNSKENLKLTPTNDELLLFFKKLIDNYWLKIPLIDLYDCSIIENDYFADKDWHMPSSSISFGIPDETDYDIGTKYDKHGVIISYCDVIAGIVPWSKKEGTQTNQMYNGFVSNDCFMCVDHAKEVEHYFNNVYGCGHCKYKEVCNSRHFFTLCYAKHQYNWQENHCYIKRVFKHIEDKKNDQK